MQIPALSAPLDHVRGAFSHFQRADQVVDQYWERPADRRALQAEAAYELAWGLADLDRVIAEMETARDRIGRSHDAFTPTEKLPSVVVGNLKRDREYNLDILARLRSDDFAGVVHGRAGVLFSEPVLNQAARYLTPPGTQWTPIGNDGYSGGPYR